MKTRKNNKQGISLIVLVITIIVMIILAAAVILSLSSNGIIDRANDAVNKTDKKQLQLLAETIWAEAYMDKREGKIDSIEATVKENLEKELGIEEGNLDRYYDLEVSENGVTISSVSEREWLTIYDKGEETQDRMLVLDVKTMLASTLPYRITVESDEYTGQIEAKPLLIPGDNIYVFGAIDRTKQKDNVIYFSSAEEAGQALTSSGANLTFVGAGITKQSGQNVGLLAFQGATCEYTVNSIEVAVNNVKKIYEGNEILEDNKLNIPQLNVFRRYYVVYEVDGEEKTDIPYEMLDGGSILTLRGAQNYELWLADGMIYIINGVNAKLKAIYDIGENDYFVRENGYTATSDGILVKTPNTEYVIPTSVAGVSIHSIYMPTMSGTAIIDRHLDVKFTEHMENTELKKLIFKAEASSMLETEEMKASQIDFGMVVDLSECGPDITFPERWLERASVIYVDPQLKSSQYADNQNVVAK